MSPTKRPKVRYFGKRRFYDPEPQWFANATDDLFSGGWVVYRQRPEQHAYGLRFNGDNVGYLLRVPDGWHWQTTWNPRTGSSRIRTSTAAYPTWQAAASRLIRTDVGRRVCRGQKPPPADAWRLATGVQGKPWEPKPAEPDQQQGETDG